MSSWPGCSFSTAAFTGVLPGRRRPVARRPYRPGRHSLGTIAAPGTVRFVDPAQLDEAQRQALVAAAVAARRHAYCPYSGFAVGAAVLTAGGDLVAGCNVENAAYPAGICAERAAIAAAVAAGTTDLRGLAVVADTVEPIVPCGLCRQTIAEFAPRLPLVLATLAGRHRVVTLDELLPEPFSPAVLPPRP